jgi:hypothetical protein
MNEAWTDVGPDRYCENIGREHKSNNVMFVVDLKQRFFYQKCFDPDCRHFRSNARPVPPHVWSVKLSFLHR